MRMPIGAVFAAAFAISGAAQDFIVQSGVPAVAFPKPDRPVADIVSPIWHDEKERDDAGEPGQLVRLLGIKSGMTVADIGAGSGYYVVRLSPIVGSNGRIIAEDIVPKYLRSLRKRVRDLGLQNVVISLGEPHDPKLPADSVDIAILVHMYHEIQQPYALLYNLVPALKPQARYPAKSPALRARSRWLSRDQFRSAHRQRCLSRDLWATVRCKPYATGSDSRVQGAVADCVTTEIGRGGPSSASVALVESRMGAVASPTPRSGRGSAASEGRLRGFTFDAPRLRDATRSRL